MKPQLIWTISATSKCKNLKAARGTKSAQFVWTPRYVVATKGCAAFYPPSRISLIVSALWVRSVLVFCQHQGISAQAVPRFSHFAISFSRYGSRIPATTRSIKFNSFLLIPERCRNQKKYTHGISESNRYNSRHWYVGKFVPMNEQLGGITLTASKTFHLANCGGACEYETYDSKW